MWVKVILGVRFWYDAFSSRGRDVSLASVLKGGSRKYGRPKIKINEKSRAKNASCCALMLNTSDREFNF